MIHSLAVDLEVFENMISFTFVDVRDYLESYDADIYCCSADYLDSRYIDAGI